MVQVPIHETAAFLRHPNFSKDIQDLYFTGGSVHPAVAFLYV